MAKVNEQIKKSSVDLSVKDSLNNDETFIPSSFAKVRESKTEPVQAHLDGELSKVIGTSFLLVAVDEQNVVDPKTGKVNVSTLYTVRVISSKAKAYRELINIKVKNSHPIIEKEELDQVMLQTAKPIILRFDNIAHYVYMGGETINASAAERLNISVREAMNHE